MYSVHDSPFASDDSLGIYFFSLKDSLSAFLL